MKVKGEDYCKIHRICTRLTARKVWEILAWDETLNRVSVLPKEQIERKMDEICAVLPAEYAGWVLETASQLLFTCSAIMHSVFVAVDAVDPTWQHSSQVGTHLSRKDVVARLQAEFPDVWHEALHIFDGQFDRAEESIWKRIKPGHELPILRDGEDE